MQVNVLPAIIAVSYLFPLVLYFYLDLVVFFGYDEAMLARSQIVCRDPFGRTEPPKNAHKHIVCLVRVVRRGVSWCQYPPRLIFHTRHSSRVLSPTRSAYSIRASVVARVIS